jgi:putative transposase
MGNSTFYKWREKYGGIETSDIKRLKELEAENRKLKQMFAKLSYPSASGRNHKKALVPTKARKTWAQQRQQNHSVTIAMSYKLAEYHGYPLKIRGDNGPEFTGKTFIN